VQTYTGFTSFIYDLSLSITSANSVKFVVGHQNSFTILTGSPSAAFLPARLLGGLIFTDNGDGTATLSGMPQTEFNTDLEIQATSNGKVGPPKFLAIGLTGAPSISSDNQTVFTGGENSTFSIATDGNPAPALTIYGQLPTFVQSSGVNIGGTPPVDAAGTYYLLVVADNRIAPAAMQAFTLIVN
jgi:hypothetical protein